MAFRALLFSSSEPLISSCYLNCTNQRNSFHRTKLDSFQHKDETLTWDSANVIASLSEEPTEGRENIVNVADMRTG
jgi:hypothetical protein